MTEEKYIKPNVLIKLNDFQLRKIKDLVEKRKKTDGMILGSLSLDNETLALSLIDQDLSLKILDIAFEEMGDSEENDDLEDEKSEDDLVVLSDVAEEQVEYLN